MNEDTINLHILHSFPDTNFPISIKDIRTENSANVDNNSNE